MNEIISNISLDDYRVQPPTKKLNEVDTPNFYFKVSLKNRSYFAEANFNEERVEAKYIEEEDQVVFIRDNWLHILNYSTGQILLALKLQGVFDKVIYSEKFLFVIDEFVIYQIAIHSTTLYKIIQMGDVITQMGDVITHVTYSNQLLVVNTLNGEKQELKL